jgi:predicted MFS family arabinose efflux permease
MDTVKGRWAVVGLLFCSAALNYGDRTAITALFPLLRQDLSMTDMELAAVSSFFLWAYALVSPMAGYFGDRRSRPKLIVASLCGWSAVTALSAFAANAGQLLSMRAALGLVEAAYMPAAVGLLAACHGPATRGMAMGIHTAGYSVGMVVGGAAAGCLGQRLGWRFPMALLGVIGIALSAVCYRFFARFPHVQDETGPAPAARPWRALTAILSIPACRIILAEAMLAGTAMWILLTWMPLYFRETFGMTLAAAGFSGTFYSQTGMIAGMLLGGRPSDAVGRKGARYRMGLHGALYLAAAPFLLGFLWSRELWVIAAVSLGFFFLRSLGIANEHPVLTEVLPANLRSTAVGVSNSLNCLAGGAGVLIAGYAKRTFGLSGVFATVSLLYVICAALLFVGYSSWRDPDRQEAGSGLG